MKLKELENIVFESSSNFMKHEGEKAFNSGLVIKIKGKKIENMYHIYGCVISETKSSEVTTHIKIDLLKKKLDAIRCTCKNFKELSTAGHPFMCSHLTATAFRFFALAGKNNDEKDEKSEVNKKSDENIKDENMKD